MSIFRLPLDEKIILSPILILGLLLRLFMLYLNLNANHLLFYCNKDTIESGISAEDKPYQNLFGSEISNVAYSLVCKKQGLSNPFGDKTGPTGWTAPGMVLLYALSFSLFGCYTFPSIFFFFVLSLCLSLIMIVLVYQLSKELFGSSYPGYAAAFLFAVSPPDFFIFRNIYEQDFNILIFLFLFLFFIYLRFTKFHSIVSLILFVIVAVIAIFCNPVFIFPVLTCLLFTPHLIKQKSYAYRSIVLSLLIMSFMLFPYIIYQKLRLNAWFFIKSNSPFEIYLGNIPEGDGLLSNKVFQKYHPIQNIAEYKLYKRLSEKGYIHSRFALFYQNFDFLRFIQKSLRKFLYFFFVFPSPEPGNYHRKDFLVRAVTYPLNGFSLLLYIAIRWHSLNIYDGLIYTYILSYAFPYLFAGMMYRYSSVITPYVTIFLGYTIFFLGKKVLSKGP